MACGAPRATPCARRRGGVPLAVFALWFAVGGGASVAAPAIGPDELGAHPPTARAPLDRRRARDIITTDVFFLRQPFLTCSGVTRVVQPTNSTPECCVVTALECARRCQALSLDTCLAFAVSVYTDTPLAALLPPAPAGGTWQKCELYAAVDTPTCRTQLQFLPVTGNGAFTYSRAGGDVWDYYFASLSPQLPSGQTAVSGELVLSGVAPAALANDGANQALAFAVQNALQVTCCAAVVLVSNVRDASSAAGRRRLAQQGAAVRVSIEVTPLMANPTMDYGVLVTQVVQALASAAAQALVLQQLKATGFPNAAGAAFSWQDALPSSVCGPARPRGVIAGLAVGLGAPLSAALAALAVLLSCFTLVRRSRWRRRSAAARKHDVFISYRRSDLQIVDAVHDKCALAGLRVFYDRGGAMAGKPFELELFSAIRDTPCFAPMVTLELMRVLAAHRADTVDYVLAELMVAMHFWRSGRVRLILPLLVGERSKGSAASGGGERDCLPFNEHFVAARDAMPAVVPTATIALVAAMFKASGGEELDPELAQATVRDLIVGPADASSAAEPEAGETVPDEQPAPLRPVASGVASRICGLLEQSAVLLRGPDEQAGLVLRHRYAQRIAEALHLSD